MAIKSSDQITIVDLTDAYSIMLSMDAVALTATSSSKLGTAQTMTINVMAFRGEDQLTPTVGTPTCPENVTASVGTASNSMVPITITFGVNLATNGAVQIPVSVDDITITKEFSFSIALKGATGTAGTVRELQVSTYAVVQAENGTFSPSSITLKAYSTSGTANPAAYAGRFKIETTTDFNAWTAVYTSSANESSKTYTVPSGIKAMRCSLYLAGGTTTLLDQQIVPIVSDGATGATGSTGSTGPAGADAYTVLLTDESHTFQAGISAAVATNTTINVIAYKGATQVAATIGTITGQVTGMTTSLVSNSTTSAGFKVTVTTALTTKSGTLTIPITVDGQSFTKKFTWSLALTGATGDKGDKGEAGDDAISMVITSSNGTIFKNTAIATVLTAHVYQGGAEVTGSALTALGTIKWYKDGSSTALSTTGATLTISAGDVTNKAIYEAKLES